MKKILLSLVLSCATCFADAYVTNNMAASSAQLNTNRATLVDITLFSTNASPTIVYLYDGALTVANAAYTNYTIYTTNAVKTYITTTGITNTFTNTVITSVTNAVAAATNAAVPRISIVVPGGNSPVYFTQSAVFANYLRLSNSLAGLSFVLNYRNN